MTVIRSMRLRRCPVALIAAASMVVGCSYAYGTTSESATPNKWSDASQRIVGELDGVSCLGLNRCVAVGESTVDATLRPLAEFGNRDDWTVTPTPNAGHTTLTAVSCLSMTRCWTVGYSSQAGGPFPTIEVWNGNHWSIKPSPTTAAFLLSVSCVSETSCVAVGKTADSSSLPFAEVWNGKHWSVTATANLPLEWSGTLTGVSCTGPTDCDAVGSTTPPDIPTQTLVERWDGTRWSVVPTPTRSFVSREFTAVSCVSPDTCVAVGSLSGNNGGGTLVELWNGTTWSIVSSPNHPHQFSSALTGVSCSSANSCVAVGTASFTNDDQNPVVRTLIERWNGHSWTIGTSPAPSGFADYNSLAGVSCTSEHCEPVGWFYYRWRNFTIDTLRLSGFIPS